MPHGVVRAFTYYVEICAALGVGFGLGALIAGAGALAGGAGALAAMALTRTKSD